MSAQDEPEREKRNYPPRAIPGVAKYRSGADWSQMPDYERMPAFTLIGISEVCLLTGFGKSAIERRIRDGRFPAPHKVATRDRKWQLGTVRDWCKADAPEGGA